MPLPMVHLSIAVQAHALAGRSLRPEFLLGSLAPDAIHMRANSSRDDKIRVHLRVSEAGEPEALERIRLLLGPNPTEKTGPDPFAAGYAAHLLVDYWWLRAVVRPFGDQLPPGTLPAEHRAWYYRETDHVDFNLYQRAPWRQTVWAMLAAACAPDFPPYLTADEIDRWRQRTLTWFESQQQAPGTVPQIITEGVVEAFIQDSVQRIRAFLWQGEG